MATMCANIHNDKAWPLLLIPPPLPLVAMIDHVTHVAVAALALSRLSLDTIYCCSPLALFVLRLPALEHAGGGSGRLLDPVHGHAHVLDGLAVVRVRDVQQPVRALDDGRIAEVPRVEGVQIAHVGPGGAIVLGDGEGDGCARPPLQVVEHQRQRPRAGGGDLDAAVVVGELGLPGLGPGLAVVGGGLAVEVHRLPVPVEPEQTPVLQPRHRRLRQPVVHLGHLHLLPGGALVLGPLHHGVVRGEVPESVGGVVHGQQPPPRLREEHLVPHEGPRLREERLRLRPRQAAICRPQPPHLGGALPEHGCLGGVQEVRHARLLVVEEHGVLGGAHRLRRHYLRRRPFRAPYLQSGYHDADAVVAF
mmetsp:Transcript_6421/g.13042  ORF Transcript_6421/g.13042 Transcript_6421/m.13042 type:complete len:362 (-) Transcript_6421:668-1753(-)